mmetsp:Transcript_42015/g.69906  ORF Transcript_42015/g.69906 Transcript_42015/m.69906 type:complete len:102 (+) Transcript_42015:100-405(+)
MGSTAGMLQLILVTVICIHCRAPTTRRLGGEHTILTEACPLPRERSSISNSINASKPRLHPSFVCGPCWMNPACLVLQTQRMHQRASTSDLRKQTTHRNCR